MGRICVLKAAIVESAVPQQSGGRTGGRPVSLLDFLQAENLRLQNAVAELERETATLRAALHRN
jgi:hypothetical protein